MCAMMTNPDRRVLLFLMALFFLAACAPSVVVTPTAPVSAVTPAPSSVVNFSYPPEGTIVYADKVYLSGTAQNITTFHLQLIGTDKNVLARATVQVKDGQWQVEVPHTYMGEPTEVTIFALPADDAAEGSEYGVTTIALAGKTYRPEGTFGQITDPAAGSAVGGDSIQVSGSASGVFENTFTLALMNGDRVIDQQTVTMINPYFVDDVPWSAELKTNGYTGPVQLVAYAISPKDGSKIRLGEVKNLTVTADAG
jgi:hypothetical protein